jgi:6,7-dimethyl-8-ribityllumazine synthase
MTHTRYAFVKAVWHADIVGKALEGFLELVPPEDVDVFDVPGAFELPLLARDPRCCSGGRSRCRRGIYRHEFVADAVVNGLMRAGLDSGVPVLSVSLTPHQYQETDHHKQIYLSHFIEKRSRSCTGGNIDRQDKITTGGLTMRLGGRCHQPVRPRCLPPT